MSTTESIKANSRTTPPWGEIARQPVFATTHWSVVLTAGRNDLPQAQDALEKLCQTYWYPLYVYVRRRGYAQVDAEDLTQKFFEWLLERNWLGQADQQRGRFRSFLLTSLSRFLANEWDKARAQKRGRGRVVSLNFEDAENGCAREPVDNVSPEQSFEWRWALTLLDQVLNRLCAEYAAQGKAELFAELKPCLLGERAAQPYAMLASKLGMTEGSVKVVVHRLRQRYRQLLRDEIANTVATPEEVEEELRHLFTVLARR
ncbi:RNA polymerase sigma factor [Pedosphaera parvula]|uniref:RNA polymerase, sigma-24 subunit, ECF subfamily n=1 Tax=Pedosphaera parvula (strain Ellin514) TaxID=320771 RepID=B9XQ22_PEDPL|nr:sigma-70 family RNA polymerase sigma factor [Pedosphaera parvula]EEF58026.1 RNA polymerase, sigma-24 subunit, ECF subfamily [Pedosphaera parvula Ellin514]